MCIVREATHTSSEKNTNLIIRAGSKTREQVTEGISVPIPQEKQLYDPVVLCRIRIISSAAESRGLLCGGLLFY